MIRILLMFAVTHYAFKRLKNNCMNFHSVPLLIIANHMIKQYLYRPLTAVV